MQFHQKYVNMLQKLSIGNSQRSKRWGKNSFQTTYLYYLAQKRWFGLPTKPFFDSLNSLCVNIKHAATISTIAENLVSCSILHYNIRLYTNFGTHSSIQMSSCTKYNVVCCNTTSFLVYVMFSNLTGNVKWTCCFIHESEFTSQTSRPQKLPKLKSNSSASCIQANFSIIMPQTHAAGKH